MAKTYLDTVKYMIKMKYEVDGIVEKPDLIGAIFGQSEGLLGVDMDLKELQQNGKIGRIEITTTTSLGKTKGDVLIPSSMDMVQTSILAAAIESVDKVGPCDAKFEALNIEDTRRVKRKEITDRAKNLLKKFMTEQIPESNVLAEEVRDDMRTAEIQSFGPDKLPCGPTVLEDNSIIIVEGRADVLTLLKNGLKNVIGMNGSNIPQSLLDLCRNKEVTLFVDGDRGGDLNARKLQSLMKVDFIANAPAGKEVEELERKEILLSLKRKRPAGDGFESTPRRGFRSSEMRGPPMRERGRFSRSPRSPERDFGPRKPFGARDRGTRGYGFRENRDDPSTGSFTENSYAPLKPLSPVAEEEIKPTASAEEQSLFRPLMQKISGKLSALLLNAEGKELKEVPVRELIKSLSENKGVETVVFDGVITARLADEAEKAGVKTLVGLRKGKIGSVKVKTITLSA
ncbi:MAG: DNA primase DnaG [Candidatus Diapherotrites archaeon]